MSEFDHCTCELTCVCEAVRHINDLQDAVEDQCPTSCYSNLLQPQFIGDTIPFILKSSGNCSGVFLAVGNIGDFEETGCFHTPFFRVEKFRDDCCATLSLLRPFKGSSPVEITTLDDICEVTSLQKTNFCIEVDLTCFCAIQCLSPLLVKSSL